MLSSIGSSLIARQKVSTRVFKNGHVDDTDNHHGITALSVFAKIFETAVNNRIVHASEAFLKGSRTTDNIFIV